jgi:glutathione S-transferase
VLKRNGRYLVGSKLTYADLSKKYPSLMALNSRVKDRPRIAAYLASERRIAFNEEGIFRHYAELD